MTNYNYYNNLTNRFKKNSSIGQNDKTHVPTFDKPVYDGYNLCRERPAWRSIV